MMRVLRVALLVLGSAVAATAAGTADAALISEAPTGSVPVTIGLGAGASTTAFSFDIDGNGTNDFSITADTTGIYLKDQGSDGASSSLMGFLNINYSASDLSLDNVGSFSKASIQHSGAADMNYAALAINFTANPPANFFLGGTGTLGYLQGAYTPGATQVEIFNAELAGKDLSSFPSFKLLDYGLVGSAMTTAVPEPASWTMMILGVGAVGFAMRRRRKVVTRVPHAA